VENMNKFLTEMEENLTPNQAIRKIRFKMDYLIEKLELKQ
jgi:hypothetical protein